MEKRINGYIYNAKTAEGFSKMKKQGIPKPLFHLQDKFSKALFAQYRRILRKIFADLKSKLAQKNITQDGKDDDSLESLLKFFDAQNQQIKRENDDFQNRLNAQFAAEELKREWTENELDINEKFIPFLEKILEQNKDDYLSRLKEDASDKLSSLMNVWEIDKDKFFSDNIEGVKKFYLDNSLERIAEETDILKQKVLKAILDYASGKTEILDISDLAKECLSNAESLSRFFARDQMQRFNKACTLATFESASVSKIKWVTSNDGRVRESHKRLNGKIFPINELPKEIDDYNCRCGLVPVEYEE